MKTFTLISFFFAVSLSSSKEVFAQNKSQIKSSLNQYMDYVSNYYAQQLVDQVNKTSNLNDQTDQANTAQPEKIKRDFSAAELKISTLNAQWDRINKFKRAKVIKKMVVWKYRVSTLLIPQCCPDK